MDLNAMKSILNMSAPSPADQPAKNYDFGGRRSKIDIHKIRAVSKELKKQPIGTREAFLKKQAKELGIKASTLRNYISRTTGKKRS